MPPRPHHDASGPPHRLTPRYRAAEHRTAEHRTAQHRNAAQRSSLLRRCCSGAAAAALALGGLGVGAATTADPAQAAALSTDAGTAESLPLPDLDILEDTAVPGETITVAGEDWPAEESLVLTLYGNDGEAILRTEDLRAGSDGTFSTAAELPADAAPGSLSAVVSSADRPEVAASAQLAVEPGAETSPEPFLDLAQTSILPGESIILTGEGWPAGGEVDVLLSDQRGEELRSAAITADTEGRISITVLVPTDAEPGLLTMTAWAEGSGARSTMIPVLDSQLLDSPYPAVQLSGAEAWDQGSAGPAVGLTGQHWTPGDLLTVALYDDAGEEAVRMEGVPAGEDGELLSSLELPAELPDGTLTAVVTSEDEPAAVASDQLPWAAPPGARAASLAVAEPQVEPGESLALSGTGWSADAVTVTASGPGEEQLFSAEPTVQEEGTFSVDIAVPEDAEPGLLRLTAVEEGVSSTVLVPVVRMPEAFSAEEPPAESTQETGPGTGADDAHGDEDGAEEDEEALVAEEGAGSEETGDAAPQESPAPSGAVLTEDPEDAPDAASEHEEQTAPLALTGAQTTGLAGIALGLLVLGAGTVLAAREIRKLQDL